MTRYIDADALKEFIESAYRPLCDDYHMKDYVLNQILTDIKNAPTVDAVEVIRCKDCKHYYALNEVRGNCSEYNFVEKIPIDYCSWAERKEE